MHKPLFGLVAALSLQTALASERIVSGGDLIGRLQEAFPESQIDGETPTGEPCRLLLHLVDPSADKAMVTLNTLVVPFQFRSMTISRGQRWSLETSGSGTVHTETFRIRERGLKGSVILTRDETTSGFELTLAPVGNNPLKCLWKE